MHAHRDKWIGFPCAPYVPQRPLLSCTYASLTSGPQSSGKNKLRPYPRIAVPSTQSTRCACGLTLGLPTWAAHVKLHLYLFLLRPGATLLLMLSTCHMPRTIRDICHCVLTHNNPLQSTVRGHLNIVTTAFDNNSIHPHAAFRLVHAIDLF